MHDGDSCITFQPLNTRGTKTQCRGATKLLKSLHTPQSRQHDSAAQRWFIVLFKGCTHTTDSCATQQMHAPKRVLQRHARFAKKNSTAGSSDRHWDTHKPTVERVAGQYNMHWDRSPSQGYYSAPNWMTAQCWEVPAGCGS